MQYCLEIQAMLDEVLGKVCTPPPLAPPPISIKTNQCSWPGTRSPRRDTVNLKTSELSMISTNLLTAILYCKSAKGDRIFKRHTGLDYMYVLII